MKVGIIAAMKEELEGLLQGLSGTREWNICTFTLYSGWIEGVEVVLILSGIGKVNASVATTLLVENYQPDYVINTGVAGGFGEIEVGDIVVATELRHHDADATAFNYELGQIPQMPPTFTADKTLLERVKKMANTGTQLHYGPIMSGDSFVHNSRQIDTIVRNFPSIYAVEMESAAIAQTCFLFNIPCLIIRAISDKVNEAESTTTYTLSMKNVAQKSIDFVRLCLRQLDIHDTPSVSA